MSKTVVFDVKGYIADEKVMRNILATRLGIPANSDAVNEQTFSVSPKGTWSMTGLPQNSLTFLQTDNPLQLSIVSGGQSFTVNAGSFFLLTDNLTSLQITNQGTVPADVILIHA